METDHWHRMKPEKGVWIALDAQHMGIGGDDSWMSPVHSQYHIPADQPISLDVNLELI